MTNQVQHLQWSLTVSHTGIVFNDYDEQLRLQRNVSMVVLRSLGYGKKSTQNKIIEEADHLIAAFKVGKKSSSSCAAVLGSHRTQCGSDFCVAQKKPGAHLRSCEVVWGLEWTSLQV